MSESKCPFKYTVTEQKVEWDHARGSTIAITAHFFCAAAARHPLSKTGNILLSSKVQTSAGLASQNEFLLLCFHCLCSADNCNHSKAQHCLSGN